MRAGMGLCAVVLAAAAGASAEAISKPGQITIAGTSTVRSWTCAVAPAVDVTMTAAGAEALLRGERAVETVNVTVQVAEVDCNNGKMNDHLRKALKAEAHPTIRYELSTYDVTDTAEGASVSAQGELTIAGATQPVVMAITLVRDEDGSVRARGEHQVVMPQFGVKPPSLMLGTMKVGEKVTITFDVPVSSQGAVQPAV